MEAKSPDRATFVPRVEDDALLRGPAAYVADAPRPNQAYACFVRSPHAYARIAGVERRGGARGARRRRRAHRTRSMDAAGVG